ncbi:TPA: conjugal transfer protein TraM [Campylobacter fetus subsp. venerealis]|nr:conjugal transfer protein TraM [Campylobacter fetus subsp. venerealis]
MDKKAIINEIALRHNIIIDENDPILAVVSANETIFKEFEKRLENILIKQKMDLENYKNNIIQEFKNQDKIISDILEYTAKFQSSQIKINTSDDTDKKYTKDINYKIIYISAGMQIIFFLVGVIIGIFLNLN